MMGREDRAATLDEAGLALRLAVIDLVAELVLAAAAGLHRLTIRTRRRPLVVALRFVTAGLVNLGDDLNGRAIRTAAELGHLEREAQARGG